MSAVIRSLAVLGREVVRIHPWLDPLYEVDRLYRAAASLRRSLGDRDRRITGPRRPRTRFRSQSDLFAYDTIQAAYSRIVDTHLRIAVDPGVSFEAPREASG